MSLTRQKVVFLSRFLRSSLIVVTIVVLGRPGKPPVLCGHVEVHRLARGRVDLAKRMPQVSPATFNDVFIYRTFTCESIEGSIADSVGITYVGNISKVLPMEGIQFFTFRLRQSPL